MMSDDSGGSQMIPDVLGGSHMMPDVQEEVI